MGAFDLPYFDRIIASDDPGLATAFVRHVHWGCYVDPDHADDSLAGYVAAAEVMTDRVCAAGEVAGARHVLDVGCGFGGTIAHLDERLRGALFVGLNIDDRQVARARTSVPGTGANSVEFLVGDAGSLPFGTSTFEALLAVECIFHFPSRKQFLREAARVLTPGGTLALTDFVLAPGALGDLVRWTDAVGRPEEDFYGTNARPITSEAYTKIAAKVGFDVIVDDDLTANTLPTYAAMRKIYAGGGILGGSEATDYLEGMAREGLVQYRVLGFRRRLS